MKDFTHDKLFAGICPKNLLDLMREDLFWGRLEYPGGFWQLEEDISSGGYSWNLQLLKSDQGRKFKLNGRKFYSAMVKLTEFCAEKFGYEVRYNLNKNFSPFLSVIDDGIDGMNLATIGVGHLAPDEPVSDLYFTMSALSVLHAFRHFILMADMYEGTGQGKDADRLFEIAYLAMQYNERYIRRNYNTYPLEIDAEWDATLVFGGILQEAGVDPDYIVKLLVDAELFKIRRFDYFLPEFPVPCDSDGDGDGDSKQVDCLAAFQALQAQFRERLDLSYHARRNYNPIDDAHDFVLQVFDRPDWHERALMFFSESDGARRDLMMCSVVVNEHPSFVDGSASTDESEDKPCCGKCCKSEL